MKNLILLIIVVKVSVSFCQVTINPVLEVKYNIHYNTEIPNTKQGTLYIDKSLDKSIFIYGKDKNGKTFEKNDENEIRLMFSESVRLNYIDFLSDTIFSKDKIYKDEYLISEKKPHLNWELVNESKKIDTFSVKKANLKFRGRIYTAWYSDEYPIRFGPWKFHNLPGLIVEIYDDTKRYHWVLKSISKYNPNKTINYPKLIEGIEKISLEEFVILRYDTDIKLVNESRLPRGTSINKNKIKRNGIEIKFEWEEKNEED
jgi:GLPGLI family protein